MQWTITNCREPELMDAGEFQCRILAPFPGQTGNGFYLPIQGSAYAENDLPTYLEISIGHLRRRFSTFLPLGTDLGNDPRLSSLPVRFDTHISLAGVPREFHMSFHVRLQSGRIIECWQVWGTHDFALPVDGFRLRPIYLTGLGRTGTTHLSHILSKHPDIICDETFPYEHLGSTYALNVARLLTSPSDLGGSMSQGDLSIEPAMIGANPFSHRFFACAPAIEWLSTSGVVLALCQARNFTEQMYLAMARAAGKSPAFFLEKSMPGGASFILRTAYPDRKEILLVRDPRSLLRSRIRFNSSRLKPDFGAQSAGSMLEWILLTAKELTSISYLSVAVPQIHIVRYEDLMLMPEAAIAGVLDYCGLDPAMAAEILNKVSEGHDDGRMRDHRTSRDVGFSEGDLPAEVIWALERATGHFMNRFAYPQIYDWRADTPPDTSGGAQFLEHLRADLSPTDNPTIDLQTFIAGCDEISVSESEENYQLYRQRWV